MLLADAAVVPVLASTPMETGDAWAKGKFCVKLILGGFTPLTVIEPAPTPTCTPPTPLTERVFVIAPAVEEYVLPTADIEIVE